MVGVPVLPPAAATRLRKWSPRRTIMPPRGPGSSRRGGSGRPVPEPSRFRRVAGGGSTNRPVTGSRWAIDAAWEGSVFGGSRCVRPQPPAPAPSTVNAARVTMRLVDSLDREPIDLPVLEHHADLEIFGASVRLQLPEVGGVVGFA